MAWRSCEGVLSVDKRGEDKSWGGGQAGKLWVFHLNLDWAAPLWFNFDIKLISKILFEEQVMW